MWGVLRYQQNQAAKASDAYAQGLDALTRNDQIAAFNAFQTAAKSSARGYKTLALMQEAGIRLDQKRDAEAIGLFDAAASAAPDPVLADAARLKAGLALVDTAPYAQVEARLKPLTDAKRPFAPLAREGLAIAKLKAGNLNDARKDFLVLSLMATAPDVVRQRAQQAMALIDSGSAFRRPVGDRLRGPAAARARQPAAAAASRQSGSRGCGAAQ